MDLRPLYKSNESSQSVLSDIHSNFHITDMTLKESPQLTGKRRENQRKKRQQLRNSGISYVTTNKKHVKQRVCTPLPNYCSFNCYKSVSREDQIRIFNLYWSQGTYIKRKSFVRDLIQLVPKQRQRKNVQLTKIRRYSAIYNLQTDSGNIRVCKQCFILTLGETKSFVENVVSSSWELKTSNTCKDLRGSKGSANKTPQEKIEEVKNHINKFPSYQSHYSRNHTTRKYLAPGLTVKQMHSLYSSEHRNPVSIRIYREEFSKTGLRFKPPHLDTCQKCSTYEARLKYETNENVKHELIALKEIHLSVADLAHANKAKDKRSAKASNGSYIHCTFDLQKCLATPILNSSVAYYKRPLWTYNLTINNSVSGTSKCFMWHEGEGKRGANEISSCLLLYLSNLDSSVKIITFYSGSCGGQNKNEILIAALSAITANHSTIECIDYKFLEPGHNNMECNNDHSIIEKSKKRLNPEIHHPNDWCELIRNVKTINPFEVIPLDHNFLYNFDEICKSTFIMPLKNSKNERFLLQNVKWLRFAKEEGIIQYKTSFAIDEPFQIFNMQRKDAPQFTFENLKLCSTEQHKVSKEKKQDLLEMLPLLRRDVWDFYTNLSSVDSDSDKNIDPDLDILEEVDNIYDIDPNPKNVIEQKDEQMFSNIVYIKQENIVYSDDE